MAVVHDVLARFSGGTVRSTLTIDDKPGNGAGVYRVGPVVDGQGVVTEAQQKAKPAPLFSFTGLLVIGLRLGWFACQLGAKALHHGLLLFGICAWNVTHFSLMVANGLSERALAHMDDYAAQRHKVLAPWLDRHDMVKELPADVIDDTKQLAEDTVVNQLTKSKKRASA